MIASSFSLGVSGDLLHPLLDLFVCSLALRAGEIQFVHIHLNTDMMLLF